MMVLKTTGLKIAVNIGLLISSSLALSNDEFALLSFNVDNRNGQSAVKVVQCTAFDCNAESTELLGVVSSGSLGAGWRITTQHPTQKSVVKLLLINKSDQRTCNINLSKHGPFMMITPRFQASTKTCEVQNLTN